MSDTVSVTDSVAMVKDAYEYVLGLVTADTDRTIAVQGKYEDDKLRDLMGASAGVLLGIFQNSSGDFRSKVAAGLQYGITGDESFLKAANPPDDVPGQYL